MYMFINAVILALLLPAVTEQKAADGPACHAELNGRELITRFELPTGMVIEGPWRVVHRGDVAEGDTHHIVFAQLDRVIETDALTGERVVIPFPEPVRLAFEGQSQHALIRNAAQTWCITVMRAQQNRSLDRISPDQMNQTRITALSPPDDRA
jgi:hypothetical protein